MVIKWFLLWAIWLFSPAVLAADNQYQLGVDGLACPFCAFGIEKRLNKIDGVTGIEVDIGDSLVRVSMEEGKYLTREQARQAVKEAGFTLRSYAKEEAEDGGRDAP